MKYDNDKMLYDYDCVDSVNDRFVKLEIELEYNSSIIPICENGFDSLNEDDSYIDDFVKLSIKNYVESVFYKYGVLMDINKYKVNKIYYRCAHRSNLELRLNMFVVTITNINGKYIKTQEV